MSPSPAFGAMLDTLRTTRGNIRSLGPAGALEPYTPYRNWLRAVEDAIQAAENEQHAWSRVVASLAAAVSLLEEAERIGKRPSLAAPSKRMFDQMLADYRTAITEATLEH